MADGDREDGHPRVTRSRPRGHSRRVHSEPSASTALLAHFLVAADSFVAKYGLGLGVGNWTGLDSAPSSPNRSRFGPSSEKPFPENRSSNRRGLTAAKVPTKAVCPSTAPTALGSIHLQRQRSFSGSLLRPLGNRTQAAFVLPPVLAQASRNKCLCSVSDFERCPISRVRSPGTDA